MGVNMNDLVLLGILFFCHYLGDYSHLTRPWMLKAKATGSPILPIFTHALVHTVLMGIVLLFYINFYIFGVAGQPTHDIISIVNALILQLISHTCIDVFKGKLNRFEVIKSPISVWHWYTFGFDQYLHHFVILIMVYLLK